MLPFSCLRAARLFVFITSGLSLLQGTLLGESDVSAAPAQSQQASAPPAAPPREVPARSIPVPDTVSPQMQAIIAQPMNSNWNDVPKTTDEWKARVEKVRLGVVAELPRLREAPGVTVVPTTLNGVKAFVVTPKAIPSRNRDRVLLHLHGGYRVFYPGLFTNEFVDNSIVSQDGFVRATIALYANGHDLKDPLLSPVYGDMHGFPPAILTSGTRDLYLSNAVRVHRKLRAAGVEAVLQMWEGQSHAQFNRDVNGPETKEYNEEVARFFDLHLGR